MCVAVLLAIGIASWLPRWRGPLDLRWDAGVYYTLGVSLAQGSGYRLLNEPGEIPAVQYPPVVPSIVAWHVLLAGTNDPAIVGSWLKLTWLAMFLLFAAATYAVLRDFVPAGWAFTGVLFCVFNFTVYFYANQVGSELPFALACVGLVLTYRLRGRKRREAAAGAIAAVAFFTRTIGVALFVAWILDGILRREFRLVALRSAIALACLLGWSAYIHGVESSPGYVSPAYPYQRAGYLFHNVSYARNMAYKDPFRPELGRASPRSLLTRVSENARLLPGMAGEAISAPGGFWDIGRLALARGIGFEVIPGPVWTLLRLGIGILVWAGVVLLFARRQWFIPASIAGTSLLICASPWPGQILRYLAPILPLLVLAFLTALLELRSRAARYTPARFLRFAPPAMAAGILLLQLGSYVVAHTIHSRTASYRTAPGANASHRQLWYRQPDQALDESIDWIQAHAKPRDIVAASMPHWIFLRTGLKTVMPPFESEPATAQKMLDSVPVRYLVQEDPRTLTNLAGVYMAPMLDAFPGGWRLAHVSAGSYIRVYERVRPGGDSHVPH